MIIVIHLKHMYVCAMNIILLFWSDTDICFYNASLVSFVIWVIIYGDINLGIFSKIIWYAYIHEFFIQI